MISMHWGQDTALKMWVNEGIGSPAFQARSWKA
jgi:hypothetical protein